MASEYAYASITDIENYTGIDYSAVDSVRLADGRTEKKITIAERMVNAYLGVSVAQTVTDAVKMCTIVLAAKMLHNSLKELGYHEGEGDVIYINMTEAQLLDFFMNRDVAVESIPMTGASYHKSDSGMI